jgi:hypothetical protein
MELLPTEIVLEIAKYLDLFRIVNLSLTFKKFNEIFRDEEINEKPVAF